MICRLLLSLPLFVVCGICAAESSSAMRTSHMPEVLQFSPEGEVAKVRQVSARFSRAVAGFGNPRAPAPFDVDCPEMGQGRWVDPENWVYDFERDLPTGIACRFVLRGGKGKAFRFTTGGPRVGFSYPYGGAQVAENQVWLLSLSSPAIRDSVLQHARCLVSGEEHRVALLDEAETTRLAEQHGWRSGVYLGLSCGQLPPSAKVVLLWSKDIASPFGVASERDQMLEYRVRGPLTYHWLCQWQSSKERPCAFDEPIRIVFSAPVDRDSLTAVALALPDGTIFKPKTPASDSTFMESVEFAPPFPPLTKLAVHVPPSLRDDSGRSLGESVDMPREISIADVPSLVGFTSGPTEIAVMEREETGGVPVIMQNVDVEVPLKVLHVPNDDTKIEAWLRRLDDARNRWGPLLQGDDDPVETRTLKKPHADKSREVVVVPLKAPGLYILDAGHFTHTTVLVTNLAVHFRRTGEGALVWVTTLDRALPVAGVEIALRGCGEEAAWRGTTDDLGLARIAAAELGKFRCDDLLVTAHHGGDLGMVRSSWQAAGSGYLSGNLPIVHGILDRPLFRAGETAHMKHVVRLPTSDGFAMMAEPPKRVSVRHLSSGQTTELKWTFDAASGTIVSDWPIPADARLGKYQTVVEYESSRNHGQSEFSSAVFSVEEFRLPTMKAEVRLPAGPLVAPTHLDADLALSYLAGGGVDQRVRFKAAMQPASIQFPGYDDFVFGFGDPSWRNFRIAENLEVALDASGHGRAPVENVPAIDRAMDVTGEMEFADANGEVQTVSAGVRLWPADVVLGVKTPYWASAKSPVTFQVAALAPDGGPRAGVAVTVDGRLIKTTWERVATGNGLYRNESKQTTTDLPGLCRGATDEKGLLKCAAQVGGDGSLELRAGAVDDAGRKVAGSRSLQIFGEDGWFSQRTDRVEVLPEKHHYVGGETARVRVNLPFAPATVLLTLEREGVIETWVRRFATRSEMVEIPVKARHAPNIYISAAAVAGRREPANDEGEDAASPRFALGSSAIEIQPDAFRLDVAVAAARSNFRPRDTAKVSVQVRRLDGALLPAGTEVAVAAVDEALLQLAANPTWEITRGMLRWRSHQSNDATSLFKPVASSRGIATAALLDAPMAVRAVAPAAKMAQGNGVEPAAPVRQLFDTLLLWQARVPLDANGRASIDVPLNDSLTEFRIVAVAQGGVDLFGVGDTRVRSTKPLQIFSGLPPLVREGDRFTAQATLRNSGDQPLSGEFVARPIRVHDGGATPMPEQRIPFALAAGASQVTSWGVAVPNGTQRLDWLLDAAANGESDAVKGSEKVLPAVPLTVQQATLAQLTRSYRLPLSLSHEALAGSGRLDLTLSSHLADSLAGVAQYMRDYPHSCLEQQVSVAVSTRNYSALGSIATKLRDYLDAQGFAKFWPGLPRGSALLTAYVLAIANEAQWPLPLAERDRMLSALSRALADERLADDYVRRDNGDVRKLILLEALARYQTLTPAQLEGVRVEPNRWPTSAVIDWLSILGRQPYMADRERLRKEAARVLRARMDQHGTTLNFSNERNDYWWWYMVSPDQNAVRAVLALMEVEDWQADLPRMAKGALLKRRDGHWQTTTANAWGVLAMDAFSLRFERDAVSGKTEAALGATTKSMDWSNAVGGGSLAFDWPAEARQIKVEHKGEGRPWLTVQARAAVPLRAPFASGYRVSKVVEPVERARPGVWSRGDVVRVTLTVDAQSEMSWVALSDPVPAGATILSRGLARDSKLARADEKHSGWVWPSHEEKAFDAFRAYYRYVPKGRFSVQYTIRLNSEGNFVLPQTRVEAMYAPEMFGELPNARMVVGGR